MVDRGRSSSLVDRNSGAPAVAMVDVASPRIQTARKTWCSGRQAEAIRLFDEAIRWEPHNVQAYIVAARSYAERFQFERMDEMLDRLVQRAPQHPGVHHYVAETYALLKLPDRAQAAYERAAQLPGGGPPTWMELAALYERSHRLEEAEALIERTVKAGYDLPLVHLVRGRVQRRQKRTDDAEATFRSLIARVPADSEWACQAWGELALMKDQEGDFEGAIDAIGRCKRVQKTREAPHWGVSEKMHALMKAMVASVTRDDFRRWREAAKSLTPQRVALLTGFPRSGTTLLEQMLDAHSDLVSSEERDFIGYELSRTLMEGRGSMPFLDVLNALSSDQIESQRQRYFHFMEYLLGRKIGGRLHLDKNPAYNLIIPLLLRIFPEARLVVALRDPRDVVLSCYLRYLPLNSVSVRFLDIHRTAERYVLDMTAWLKFRELIKAPWCEIRYEDVVGDMERQARRAVSTLDLAWSDQVLAYRQGLMDRKRVNSPSYEAVSQPIYTRAIGRWRHYQRLLEPAFDALAPLVREFGYDS